MVRIELHGKYAFGKHRFAIVDEASAAWLSRWRWKAKPNANGTHVYAVRNVCRRDGTHTLARMHRVVAGYDGPLDVDHINGDTLDNRTANLRVVSRAENVAGRVTMYFTTVCVSCGARFGGMRSAGAASRRYCCDSCRPQRPPRPKHSLACARCGARFETFQRRARWCSEACKAKAKFVRLKATPGFEAHRAANIARCRAWREARRALRVS